MTAIFWAAAGASALIALAFVLTPLLSSNNAGFTREARRIRAQQRTLDRALADGHMDQAAYNQRREALKKELESLLDKPQPAERPILSVLAVLFFLPAVAVMTYLAVGEPRALNAARVDLQNRAAAPTGTAPAAAAQQQQAQDLQSAIAGLAQRLEQNPEDVNGWVLLGQSYLTVADYDSAERALARAYELDSDNPTIMEFYANAMIFASDEQTIPQRAEQLLKNALEYNPASQRALYFLGIAAFQQGEYEQALDYWGRLQEQLEPDSDIAKRLAADMNAARTQLGRPLVDTGVESETAADETSTASVDETPAPAPQPAEGEAPGLTVEVSLADTLRSQVSAGDVLFIFARAANGPKIPLALQRLPAGQLPVTVRLDESMSMMPAMTLSSFPEVVVGARISKSGNATPQPGDLQALSDPVPNNTADPIQLTIDQVL